MITWISVKGYENSIWTGFCSDSSSKNWVLPSKSVGKSDILWWLISFHHYIFCKSITEMMKQIRSRRREERGFSVTEDWISSGHFSSRYQIRELILLISFYLSSFVGVPVPVLLLWDHIHGSSSLEKICSSLWYQSLDPVFDAFPILRYHFFNNFFHMNSSSTNYKASSELLGSLAFQFHASPVFVSRK